MASQIWNCRCTKGSFLAHNFGTQTPHSMQLPDQKNYVTKTSNKDQLARINVNSHTDLAQFRTCAAEEPLEFVQEVAPQTE